MKLFSVYLNNGKEYEDEDSKVILIVAENEDIANARAKEMLDKTYEANKIYGNKPYFYVEEISEVDGYKIIVESK
jgi:hypothetical protein